MLATGLSQKSWDHPVCLTFLYTPSSPLNKSCFLTFNMFLESNQLSPPPPGSRSHCLSTTQQEHPILVSWGCHNKVPQTRRLTKEIHSVTVQGGWKCDTLVSAGWCSLPTLWRRPASSSFEGLLTPLGVVAASCQSLPPLTWLLPCVLWVSSPHLRTPDIDLDPILCPQ